MLTRAISVAAIYVIIFAQILDTSVANLALTTMAPDLGIDVLHSSWIMTAFGTGLIISFPIASILSRSLNPDAVFLYASVGFILSSIGCAFGLSPVDFILMRFLQGVASGIVVVLSQSLLIRLLGEERKAFAMSLWVSAVSLAPIFGPLIGAYITEVIGWRWIFLVNVPVVGLSLVALLKHLPFHLDPRPSDKRMYLTLLLFSISIMSMQYVLDFGFHKGWLRDPSIRSASLVSVLTFGAFLAVNQRKTYSILNLGLLRDYNYAFSMAVISVGNGLIFSSVILLPLWLQLDYAMPVITAGIVVSTGSLFAAVASPVVGHYFRPQHYLPYSLASLACLGTSFLMASGFRMDTGIDSILLSRVFFGVGVAVFTVPLTALSLSRLRSADYVGANSLTMTARVLLANVSVSVGFVYFNRRYYYEYEALVANQDRFLVAAQAPLEQMTARVVELARMAAFRDVFWWHAAAFFAMALTVLALGLARQDESHR